LATTAHAQTATQSQAGQSTTQSQTSTPPPPATSEGAQIQISAESLNRIRDAINRPSKLRIENGQLRIHVEVVAKWPSFAETAKGYDLMNGPTGKDGNPMSHSEFIGMMTPKEMYGSGGIQAAELAVIGLVNYFGQKLVRKGIEEIRNAKDEKEIAEIRARIDKELAALRTGGGGG
jgi:hypothetical protein